MNSIKKMTIIALFSALIIILTKIEIRFAEYHFHLGNVMCLLCGFFLSPLSAGFSAGLGSMLYDILFYPNGIFILTTFVNKFFMSFVTSSIKNKVINNEKKITLIISGIIGEIVYIVLYMGKTFFERYYFYSLKIQAIIPIMIEKLMSSVTNAIIAIVLSVIIYNSIKNIIKEYL